MEKPGTQPSSECANGRKGKSALTPLPLQYASKERGKGMGIVWSSVIGSWKNVNV